MAEEVKKKAPAKPRKPRAPKVVEPNLEETKTEVVAEPSVLITKPEEEEPIATEESSPVVLEPEEEEPVAVAEPSPVIDEEPKSEWLEDVDVRISASVQLPEETPTYEEFSSSLESSPVEIKKLNPNLPDSKSKWIAQIPTKNGGAHILFKGSYPRAHRAAENWNASRGIFKDVKQIRSK